MSQAFASNWSVNRWLYEHEQSTPEACFVDLTRLANSRPPSFQNKLFNASERAMPKKATEEPMRRKRRSYAKMTTGCASCKYMCQSK